MACSVVSLGGGFGGLYAARKLERSLLRHALLTYVFVGAGRPMPFTCKTLGVLVDVGHQKAVAETLGIKGRGFPRGSRPAPVTWR